MNADRFTSFDLKFDFYFSLVYTNKKPPLFGHLPTPYTGHLNLNQISKHIRIFPP